MTSPVSQSGSDGNGFVATGRSRGVGEVELVDVGEVQTGERLVDGFGDLDEGVVAGHERAAATGQVPAARPSMSSMAMDSEV